MAWLQGSGMRQSGCAVGIPGVVVLGWIVNVWSDNIAVITTTCLMTSNVLTLSLGWIISTASPGWLIMCDADGGSHFPVPLLMPILGFKPTGIYSKFLSV